MRSGSRILDAERRAERVVARRFRGWLRWTWCPMGRIFGVQGEGDSAQRERHLKSRSNQVSRQSPMLQSIGLWCGSRVLETPRGLRGSNEPREERQRERHQQALCRITHRPGGDWRKRSAKIFGSNHHHRDDDRNNVQHKPDRKSHCRCSGCCVNVGSAHEVHGDDDARMHRETFARQ